MNRLRKFLAFVLAIVCVCSLSVSAFAEGTELNSKAVSTKTKAIVIIPGILGSSLETTSGSKVWLHITNYGKMALTENGTSVYSIRSANYDNYGANNTYKTLYNSLNNAFGNNFDVILFDYDFRKTNSTAATQLANELSNYNEVVLVAHSMGGLVASKFLANSSSNRSKTTALITLGTPFVGAAKCIDVMETGNMITYNPLGVNISLFKNTIRDMSKNCYAAYQLLPTSKYYTKTGIYPLSVNGTNYSNATTQLKNTAWGKKGDGSVKPMFDTATTFHSSLFSGTTHITNYSDVTAYALGANGENTISKVNMNSNYVITALTYSNSGDGTVLLKSAGYGMPDYTYTGTDHTGMVSDSTVISRVKNIITAETGVSPTTRSMAEASSNNDIVFTSASTEVVGNMLSLNDRGWVNGADNKRINIFADSKSTLSVDGIMAIEENESVYNNNGVKIGSVWELGATGRKLYALYDGEYVIECNGDVKIEYMDSGYYEKVFEYESGRDIISIEIKDYSTKSVTCLDKQCSSIIYSADELMKMNEN